MEYTGSFYTLYKNEKLCFNVCFVTELEESQ